MANEECVEIGGIWINLSQQEFAGVLVGLIAGLLLFTNLASVLVTWKVTRKRRRQSRQTTEPIYVVPPDATYPLQNNNGLNSKNGIVDNKWMGTDGISVASSGFPPSPDGLVFVNESVYDNPDFCKDKEQQDNVRFYTKPASPDIQPLKDSGESSNLNSDSMTQDNEFLERRKSTDSMPDWDDINSSLPRGILSKKTKHDSPDGQFASARGATENMGESVNSLPEPPPPIMPKPTSGKGEKAKN